VPPLPEAAPEAPLAPDDPDMEDPPFPEPDPAEPPFPESESSSLLPEHDQQRKRTTDERRASRLIVRNLPSHIGATSPAIIWLRSVPHDPVVLTTVGRGAPGTFRLAQNPIDVSVSPPSIVWFQLNAGVIVTSPVIWLKVPFQLV